MKRGVRDVCVLLKISVCLPDVSQCRAAPATVGFVRCASAGLGVACGFLSSQRGVCCVRRGIFFWTTLGTGLARTYLFFVALSERKKTGSFRGGMGGLTLTQARRKILLRCICVRILVPVKERKKTDNQGRDGASGSARQSRPAKNLLRQSAPLSLVPVKERKKTDN